jgi:hypothetical protein
MKVLRIVALLAPLLILGCGGGDRATWRIEEVHSNSPLTGAHALLRCVDCHGSNPYGQVTSGCYGCHRADFESSSFDHAAVGSSTECAICHSTAGWSPAHFDHSLFGFPLSGRHLDVPCTSCHLEGVWAGQPSACEACHWTRHHDDPWNLALGTACGDCHTTAGWAGASFDHLARTGFELQGAHAGLQCVACHPGRDPSSTPVGCNDCHATQARDAGHPGFATSCGDCHTMTAWKPSTFDHEIPFPIARGRHSGFPCTDCHAGTTFHDYTCLSCHRQAQTDGEHREVSGYSYVSSECYRCHPRGTGGDE